MKVSVVSPLGLGAAELDRWRQLHAGGFEDNPFLSPEFACQVAAAHRQTRVAVFEDGGEIAGFFGFHAGPWPLARPLAPGLADCQGAVGVPGFSLDAHALLRAARLEVLEFDHLLAAQLPDGTRRAALVDAPVIDVSRGFDAYLAERRAASSGALSSLLRKERKLERELGAVHLELDDRRPAVLRQLMSWKSDQYRRTGRTDRFARPWIVHLVGGLFAQRAPGCRGRLVSLNADGRPIAAAFTLGSGRVLASWFPGYDPAYGRYSPGLLLFLMLARHAGAGEIPARLELGKGDEPYKALLANDRLALAEGAFDTGTPPALLRRAELAPRRAAQDFVLGHPRVRVQARTVLRQLGTIRRTGVS